MLNYIKPLAIFVAITAPVSAVAQDTDWTGFYVGAQLGLSNLDISNGPISADDNTTVYGFNAGYNHDFGKFVLGAELEYSIANYEFTGADIDTDTIRLKARGGYDIGRALLYGVVSYRDITLDSSAAATDITDTGFGFGLGVDFKATENIIIGVEYINESFEVQGVDVDANSFSLRASYKF